MSLKRPKPRSGDILALLAPRRFITRERDDYTISGRSAANAIAAARRPWAEGSDPLWRITKPQPKNILREIQIHVSTFAPLRETSFCESFAAGRQAPPVLGRCNEVGDAWSRWPLSQSRASYVVIGAHPGLFAGPVAARTSIKKIQKYVRNTLDTEPPST